jgi:hypothetical protein
MSLVAGSALVIIAGKINKNFHLSARKSKASKLSFKMEDVSYMQRDRIYDAQQNPWCCIP